MKQIKHASRHKKRFFNVRKQNGTVALLIEQVSIEQAVERKCENKCKRGGKMHAGVKK